MGAAAFPGRPFEAYLWRNGVATDLGSVGDDGCSWAHAINSRGQVVGQSFACDGSTGTTFLWENGSMMDLNSLIPPNSNLQLVDAQAINDRGGIAGLAFPPGCTQDTQCGHAFLLIPCDDDPSDEEGCSDGSPDVATPATQYSTSQPNQSRQDFSAINLTPRDIAARMQEQFRRRHGFAIWPQK